MSAQGRGTRESRSSRRRREPAAGVAEIESARGAPGAGSALRRPMEHSPFRSDADKESVFGRTALSQFTFAGE